MKINRKHITLVAAVASIACWFLPESFYIIIGCVVLMPAAVYLVWDYIANYNN